MPLLCVLMPPPGRDSRSTTHTDAPDSVSARAPASPTTPQPITAMSISLTSDHTLLFSVYAGPESPADRPPGTVRAAAPGCARRDRARLRYTALHPRSRG